MKESEVLIAFNMLSRIRDFKFLIETNQQFAEEARVKLKKIEIENENLQKQIIEIEEELKKIGVEKDVNEETN